MNPTVVFDKSTYYANDIVQAKIMIPVLPHPRTEQIEIRLQSGERVGVTYTTSTGKSTHTSIAWKTTIYSKQVEIIQITDQVTFPIEFTISYQLPDNISENVTSHQFYIFHEAHIKIDVRNRKDLHYRFPIPLVALPIEDKISSATKSSDKMNINIRELNIHRGDRIEFEILQIEDMKYRKLRVEIHQTLNKRVKGHSESKTTKSVLIELEPNQYNSSFLILPELPYSTIFGQNFTIGTILKFVFDKAFSRDHNIVFEIPYTRFTADQIKMGPEPFQAVNKDKLCQYCGVLNDKKTKRCVNCNNKI